MDYDVAIIGAGWAGFTAAQKARESGLRVALIEKGQTGGTCLNRGCIPTKALIQSAKVFLLSKKSQQFGIEATNPVIHFTRIQERKELIMAQLRQGMDFLLKGIEVVRGEARLVSSTILEIAGKKLTAKSILVACGSMPMVLPSLPFDGKKIISSDEILNLKEIPGSLLIVGGGVIGCEFAGLFSALGSRVSVIEKMPQLLPGEDREAARKLENIFKKKKITVHTNTDAAGVALDAYDLILVCIGRVPNTRGLGLEDIGVKLERGRIVIDEYLRTNIPGVYAAGDCTGKVCLAHYAAYQGELAAANILHPEAPCKADATAVPSCIFTDPEIAGVGIKEEDALHKGLEIEVKRFDFLGSGMARILDETDGFIKIIIEKKGSRTIGASIIGPKATELIGILALAVSNNLTVSQVKNTIFAHPTLSESIREALR